MNELGNFNGSYRTIKQSIQNHLEALAQERQDLASNNEMYGDEFTPGGLIATTIPAQSAAVRALKFHKFKKVFTFTNPNSGNKVTLWAKKLVR
jgi:hypothetical protein